MGSCVSKGRCPQRYQYLPVQRKVQPGRLSCSTQSCWSWLNMVALGSRGCRPHYPPVRCPAHCSSPEYRVCIGMLFFCRGKHTNTFFCLFETSLVPSHNNDSYWICFVPLHRLTREKLYILQIRGFSSMFTLKTINPCEHLNITTHRFITMPSSQPDG